MVCLQRAATPCAPELIEELHSARAPVTQAICICRSLKDPFDQPRPVPFGVKVSPPRKFSIFMFLFVLFCLFFNVYVPVIFIYFALSRIRSIPSSLVSLHFAVKYSPAKYRFMVLFLFYFLFLCFCSCLMVSRFCLLCFSSSLSNLPPTSLRRASLRLRALTRLKSRVAGTKNFYSTQVSPASIALFSS